MMFLGGPHQTARETGEVCNRTQGTRNGPSELRYKLQGRTIWEHLLWSRFSHKRPRPRDSGKGTLSPTLALVTELQSGHKSDGWISTEP